jgi:hypothetical protein
MSLSLSSLVGGSKTEVLVVSLFRRGRFEVYLYDSQRAHKKYMYAVSLSLSSARVCVERWVLVVREKWVKIFAFFARDG